MDAYSDSVTKNIDTDMPEMMPEVMTGLFLTASVIRTASPIRLAMSQSIVSWKVTFSTVVNVEMKSLNAI